MLNSENEVLTENIDYLLVELNYDDNISEKVDDSIRQWKDSRMPFLVISYPLSRTTTQQGARAVEEPAIAYVRNEGFFPTEGEAYRPGNSSTENPFAVATAVCLVGLRSALEDTSHDYRLNSNLGKKLQKIYKMRINALQNKNKWGIQGTPFTLEDIIKAYSTKRSLLSDLTPNGNALLKIRKTMPLDLAGYDNIAFTGTFDDFIRKDAVNELHDLGKSCRIPTTLNADNATKTLLIIGKGAKKNAKYIQATQSDFKITTMKAEEFKKFGFGIEFDPIYAVSKSTAVKTPLPNKKKKAIANSNKRAKSKILSNAPTASQKKLEKDNLKLGGVTQLTSFFQRKS